MDRGNPKIIHTHAYSHTDIHDTSRYRVIKHFRAKSKKSFRSGLPRQSCTVRHCSSRLAAFHLFFVLFSPACRQSLYICTKVTIVGPLGEGEEEEFRYLDHRFAAGGKLSTCRRSFKTWRSVVSRHTICSRCTRFVWTDRR